MTFAGQPRVRANDWSVLETPESGRWTPTRSVSIVIPAYRAEATLPYTLAALQVQTYPSHLLEVVVLDDGSEPELELPALRPESTRLLRATSGWGQGNARHQGAAAAEGEVIHWLDGDMLPDREHVESHMRWHHLIDHAVVLGHKTFVDAENLPPAVVVQDAVATGAIESLFAGRWTEDHSWVEKIWRRTDDLTAAGFRAFHVHVGATASVGRELYLSAGGVDRSLKLSEDVELGYRLSGKGAVFVADRGARSWHLGRSMLMRRQAEVQRYNAPFIAQRVPDFRKFREDRGRTYQVPVIEAVVTAHGHPFEEVKYTVDGVLKALPGDTRCLLVGPWSLLDDARRHPLDDPLLDLRLVKEEYAYDRGRVAFAETPTPTAFPALFRLHLATGWRPNRAALQDLVKDMQQRAHGLRSILLPDGQVVRLERTAAFERALRLRGPDEDLDDVVDQVSTTWWTEGVEEGFLHPRHAPEPVRAGPSKDRLDQTADVAEDQTADEQTGGRRYRLARSGLRRLRNALPSRGAGR